MTKIDYRMWIGLAIHALICLLQLTNPKPLFFYVTFPFVLLNILGLVFIVSGKIKTGCILFMIGSAAFIPIGLIGFFGARTVMNKLKQQDFYSEINSIEMKAIKTYKMKEPAANLGIYGGAILGVISLVGFLITAEITFLTPVALCIAFVIIGVMNRSNETIKIFENHMELKFAPAAPAKFIKYENIIGLEDKNSKLKRLYYKENGSEKKLWIPLGQHRKEDMDEFIVFLEKKYRRVQ